MKRESSSQSGDRVLGHNIDGLALNHKPGKATAPPIIFFTPVAVQTSGSGANLTVQLADRTQCRAYRRQ